MTNTPQTIEYAFGYEANAYGEIRRLESLGYATSLLAYDPERDLYVFNVYLPEPPVAPQTSYITLNGERVEFLGFYRKPCGNYRGYVKIRDNVGAEWRIRSDRIMVGI